jgi:hypothetical protein
MHDYCFWWGKIYKACMSPSCKPHHNHTWLCEVGEGRGAEEWREAFQCLYRAPRLQGLGLAIAVLYPLMTVTCIPWIWWVTITTEQCLMVSHPVFEVQPSLHLVHCWACHTMGLLLGGSHTTWVDVLLIALHLHTCLKWAPPVENYWPHLFLLGWIFY